MGKGNDEWMGYGGGQVNGLDQGKNMYTSEEGGEVVRQRMCKKGLLEIYYGWVIRRDSSASTETTNIPILELDLGC